MPHQNLAAMQKWLIGLLLPLTSSAVWANTPKSTHDIEKGGATITLMAVLAPLLSELLKKFAIPLVVLEILLGMLIGPHGLGLVQAGRIVDSFSLLGLCFLFFMAGLELDYFEIKGRPLALAFKGWIVSIALGAVCCVALQSVGLIKSSVLVTVALSTTAIGTLMPILKDSGQLQSQFGKLILGIGAAGEFGPVVMISLLATPSSQQLGKAVILVAFSAWMLLAAYLALRVRPVHVIELLGEKMHSTSQLPVRICVFLMNLLVFVAGLWGVDVILGAFGAGALVGLSIRDSKNHDLVHKLDSLSFGFLIPFFFITTGIKFDLPALASASTMLRVLIFLILLLIVRGLPCLLFYPELDRRDKLALAFYSATGLPLIVAIAEIGEHTGGMLPENCVALVGAGLLSVLIFPLVAGILRAPALKALTLG